MSNNNNSSSSSETKPVNPQKLQHDYTYPAEDEAQQQQQEAPVEDIENGAAKQQQDATSLYSEKTKALAQSKVFTVHFMDGSKKIYMRRKPSLGEVGDYEEAKQNMYQFKGKPKEMNKVIVDFYTYAASIHIRETKTSSSTNLDSGKMTPEEVKNTVFEEFKQIIDACEYAMLFNPN